MDDLRELETLAAEPVTVKVAGGAIEVRPMTALTAARFARAAKPFLGALEFSEGAVIDVGELMADHGEALIDAVAIAAGHPVDFVGELALDDFADLAAAVLEANIDFFAHRLLPRIMGRLAETLGRLGGGPTPSSS